MNEEQQQSLSRDLWLRLCIIIFVHHYADGLWDGRAELVVYCPAVPVPAVRRISLKHATGPHS